MVDHLAGMSMKKDKAAFASMVVVVAAVTMIACGSSSRGLSFLFTSRFGHGVELLEAEAAASPGHGLSLHLHSGSERSAAAQGRGGRDAMLGDKVGAMTESLSMSASARHKLSRAVAKAGRAPTESERRDMTADLDRIAGLLATQEVYKLAGQKASADESHTPGFSSWVHTLSSPRTMSLVEKRVKERMEDTSEPYAKEIESEVPVKFDQLLPALSAQAAHKAAKQSFTKLREQMIKAGEWDKGYLEHGNGLTGNPLTFDYAYKNNKKALGKACQRACQEHTACRGYTYHPAQGVCYLKAKASPVRGVECSKDCWFWGKVDGHPHEMSLSLQSAENDLGLIVHDKVVGKGREIEKGTTATIGYVGKLDDGKVFDQGKYTFTFGRGQVIKGDDLGLQGMRVGGRRKLTIPPDLGYGSRGYPGAIPPNARLHFDVRLLSVNDGSIPSGYKSGDTPE